MKTMFGRLVGAAIIAALSLFPELSSAQTSPNFTPGYIPTTAQWNAYFSNKMDYLGSPVILVSGGTLTGPLITAPSITGGAGFNIPPGTAPLTPNNGDIWETVA